MGASELMGQSLSGMGLPAVSSSSAASYSSAVPSLHPSMHSLIPSHPHMVAPHHSSPHHISAASSSPPSLVNHGDTQNVMDLHTT